MNKAELFDIGPIDEITEKEWTSSKSDSKTDPTDTHDDADSSLEGSSDDAVVICCRSFRILKSFFFLTVSASAARSALDNSPPNVFCQSAGARPS